MNVRKARALEIAEFRLERCCLKLEQMNKGMKAAKRAFQRFADAVAKLPPGIIEPLDFE